MTFDMGGTSTDVALLESVEAGVAREAAVHGHPIRAPMVDNHTVGAGGGAIAFVDFGGCSRSDRVEPALIRVRPATAAAMTSRPLPMLISSHRD
jgi:N-methylhydantoinase A/oxoprolinase/acetone carboxylase beta subunit